MEELLHGRQEAQRQTGNMDWVIFNGPSLYPTSSSQALHLLKFPPPPKTGLSSWHHMFELEAGKVSDPCGDPSVPPTSFEAVSGLLLCVLSQESSCLCLPSHHRHVQLYIVLTSGP